ncbi:VOC family protein [Methylobacterium organophilum]|uniref:Metallothiol transferase FosB n=1 Tax=Methylobacterium organophilum TaxID=410 RepID=A0ABQ4T1M8_METOR|nr:VOC family protein [Methylobacterium organophilum]GJE25545.1 Metallothiol transferase FosB [Methylobacterium organophilum]
MASTPPPLGGVLETALYVDDMERARAFYEDVLGLRPMVADHRLVAYPVGTACVLLLFRRGSTLGPVTLPGGVLPPHDGSGPLHFALRIARADLDAWIAHLTASGVPIESRIDWPKGGASLYLRDPDGHLAELATPGLWANY